VCSENKVDLIVLEEGLNTIWTELNNVSSAIRVANKVWLNTKLAITISRVAPQDVDNQLLFDRGDLVNNLKRALDLFNLLEIHQGTSNSSMQTHNTLFDHGRKRKPIEEVVNFVKNRVVICRVFA